jgi:hypothetical protein
MFFLLLGLLQAQTKIVKFKEVGNDKYISKNKDNQMVLGDYKSAIKFKLEDHSNVSEKKLIDPTTNKAFTETGWWIFPKNYYFKKSGNDGKQGFKIVYYGENEYILMRENDCLSVKSGVFKKVDCEKNNVTIFNMCTNKKCDGGIAQISRDVKFIKEALLSHIQQHPDGDKNESLDEPESTKENDNNDTEDSDSDYNEKNTKCSKKDIANMMMLQKMKEYPMDEYKNIDPRSNPFDPMQNSYCHKDR